MPSEADREPDGRRYLAEQDALGWQRTWSFEDRDEARRFLGWLREVHGELLFYDTRSGSHVVIQAEAGSGGWDVVGRLAAGYLEAVGEAPVSFEDHVSSTGGTTHVLQLSNSEVRRGSGVPAPTLKDPPVCPTCHLAHAGVECW